MAKRTSYHVTGSRGDWKVKRSGADRAASTHDNKADAVADAKTRAKSAPAGQVVVHGTSGRIQTEHTYGSDPYPPKG
jgi:hypothetical protein